MSVTYSDIVDELIGDFQATPLTAIEKAVSWAAREVCRRSGAWVVTQQDVADTSGEVMLLLPAQTELVRIVNVWGVYKFTTDSQFNTLGSIQPGQVITARYSVAPVRTRTMLPPELYWLDTAIEAVAKARLFGSAAPWGDMPMADRWLIEASRLCRNAAIKTNTGGITNEIVRTQPRRFV